MKHVSKLVALIFFAAASFSSCTKKPDAQSAIVNSSSSLSTFSAHRIKARILEYGTDRPIQGAAVEVVAISQGIKSMTTDEQGECWFNANEVSFLAFTKPGYWNYSALNSSFREVLSAPLEFYPVNYPSNGTFDYYSGRAYSCDSFVIRLFPKTYITLHLKDSSLLPVSDLSDHVNFAVNGLFTIAGIHYTVFSGASSNQDGEFIRIRPGIDTTFQFPIFGNTKNLFSVGEDDAANGWAGFLRFWHRHTIYIPNDSSVILNVTY